MMHDDTTTIRLIDRDTCLVSDPRPTISLIKLALKVGCTAALPSEDEIAR